MDSTGGVNDLFWELEVHPRRAKTEINNVLMSFKQGQAPFV
jgi:hypothetical protein